jgi:hypothetical protein
MVRTHLVIAVAIGIAITSRSAAAQHGSSTSLTHTVSVTVPPRVKVQVGSLAPVSASSIQQGKTASSQGLALSISATRAWVLSIGSGNSASKSASVRWSVDAASGYSKLTSDQVTVASGALSTTASDSMLFFQNLPQARSQNAVGGEAPVILTVTAP